MTSNCSMPTAPTIGVGPPSGSGEEHLRRALFGELAQPRVELLALHRVRADDAREVLRREARDPANSTSPFGRERVADAQRAAVDHADHVARPRLLDRGALARQELLRRRRGASACPCAPCFTCIPASKRPEQTRTKATRSRCLRVHVRLDLEDEAGELPGPSARRCPPVDSRGAGAGASSRNSREERLDAEVRERAAEEHRRELAREQRRFVERMPGLVEQLDRPARAGRARRRRAARAARDRRVGATASSARVAP